ncbi:hypothetical protein [Streptomyces sp. NPDC088760]|uniref:hypothetical protein n=1 Tax=Streptomyces sp. NPDC088760 TaxID=3365890 RepID=UPI003807A3C1
MAHDVDAAGARGLPPLCPPLCPTRTCDRAGRAGTEVMRGQGLKAWASVGLDLRQITAEHIRTELGQHQGSQARALHHVLLACLAK